MDKYGALDDIDEVFNTKDNGKYAFNVSYYYLKFFLKAYSSQLKRQNSKGLRKWLRDKTGAFVFDVQEESIKDLMILLEEDLEESKKNERNDDDER